MLKRLFINRIIKTTIILGIFLIFLTFFQTNEYHIDNIPLIVEQTNKDVYEQEIFLFNKNKLVSRTLVIMEEKTIINKVKYLLEVLTINGPKSSLIQDGFSATIPANTIINGISYDDEIVKIDFSKEFLKAIQNDEEKVIESIVYTLTGIEEVNGIMIFIDGEILEVLPKTKKILPRVLTREIGVNKIYDINSLKNINGVTIYYISNNDDNYYYVPVTKYTNNSREKIKIIIDELSSGPIYQTNLMSFLNYNIELVNYEIKDKEAILKFNEYIFDNQSTYSVLEEVAYSISLSVIDNYQIEKVSFYVDETEVFKY